MSYYSNKNTAHRQYHHENKYDKAFNSVENIQAQIGFKPNEKFLLKDDDHVPEKWKNLNTKAIPYYPLPSNEGYETFLKVMKKEQYTKTQYSLPFMLSIKSQYESRPVNMKEIKIPQKHEIRSRAKVVTEEAYRVTRNYWDENTEKRNFSITFVSKNDFNQSELQTKTKVLREILNKICYENYDNYLNQIWKFEYDEKWWDIFKAMIFGKIVTEYKYFMIYVNICIQMCKLYNKKTYSNEPKMNFKSLLWIAIQKEFLLMNETTVKHPFWLTVEEKENFNESVKYGNIRWISELFNNSVIPKKVISDCIGEWAKKDDDLSISLLSQLVISSYKKLVGEGKEYLDMGLNKLESVYNNDNSWQSKTKCWILDALDIKVNITNESIKREESSLSYASSNYSGLGAFPASVRKTSDFQSRRKSSINPKDVDYIKRSRFNSRADELKVTKEDNQGLMDELVTYLGADIEFYQCFRLTEEEFDIIKEGSLKFLRRFSFNDIDNEGTKSDFNLLIEEVQCEKFIAVGHWLEIMFSLDKENAFRIMRSIVYFFNNKWIEEEDVKHAIVLGWVNFKNNIIDYPNTKEYFQTFINMIQENNIIDGKILKIYQRCCDNLEKCYE